MNGTLFALAASALIAAGCSQPATTTAAPAAAEKMSGMETAAPAQSVGVIRATGVVTQVDAAARTITIDHQAIAAISWPAMSMQFHAENPAILRGIAVGDHVSFELKSASETGIVTMVQKQ